MPTGLSVPGRKRDLDVVVPDDRLQRLAIVTASELWRDQDEFDSIVGETDRHIADQTPSNSSQPR